MKEEKKNRYLWVRPLHGNLTNGAQKFVVISSQLSGAAPIPPPFSSRSLYTETALRIKIVCFSAVIFKTRFYTKNKDKAIITGKVRLDFCDCNEHATKARSDEGWRTTSTLKCFQFVFQFVYQFETSVFCSTQFCFSLISSQSVF